jgi:predicted transcriptional regulator
MSQTHYLQRRHQTWYVVVEVPRKHRAAVGKPRFVRSLHTRDLSEANRLKHAVVDQIKQRLHLIAQAPDPVEAAAMAKAMAEAMSWRESYLAADDEPIGFDDEGRVIDTNRGLALSLISDEAERLEWKPGLDVAKRFFSIATGKATPLASLRDQWLTERRGQVTEQTRDQHRGVLRSFMAWAGGEQVSLEQVTRHKAGAFISHLLQSGLARGTIKRHVSALSAFWRWLRSRGLTKENVWREHEIGHSKGAAVRKGFADADLIKLLTGTHTERYHAVLYDLIRLALATGARLEELCALRIEDLEQREDGWWLEVRAGKTEAAKRSVPLHKAVAGIIERRLAS